MSKTLSATNQFRFVCPIFNVETRFSQCAKIRDSVYVGAELPVRKGCQACVRDSKCPAAEIVRKLSFSVSRGGASDDYGSTEPVVGKIKRDVLEKIAPIMVQQRTCDRLAVPPAERELIASSSARIRKAIGMAPLPGAIGGIMPTVDASAWGPSPAEPTKKATKPVKKTEPVNKINQAAATGDLAAAISA